MECETILNLRKTELVAKAEGRDEKEFFGQGWSHFPTKFQERLGEVNYYLFVYNTPRETQVNWNLRMVGSNRDSYGKGELLLLALTPEESRELAATLGLNIADWLAAALEACRTDVTAEKVARDGVCVDLANFHASRAGD
jgi:hypothetical protein